jgi:hypothetical protein
VRPDPLFSNFMLQDRGRHHRHRHCLGSQQQQVYDAAGEGPTLLLFL